jgi:hypothetical protein
MDPEKRGARCLRGRTRDAPRRPRRAHDDVAARTVLIFQKTWQRAARGAPRRRDAKSPELRRRSARRLGFRGALTDDVATFGVPEDVAEGCARTPPRRRAAKSGSELRALTARGYAAYRRRRLDDHDALGDFTKTKMGVAAEGCRARTPESRERGRFSRVVAAWTTRIR